MQSDDQIYHQIFDAVRDGLALVDFDGVIIDANEAFCAMYGYERQELIGMTAPQLIHPDYQHVFHQFREQTMQTGHFQGETVDVRKDGTTFVTEARGGLVHLHGATFLLGIIRDVSERRKAEQERDRLIMELQQALGKLKKLSGLLPICSNCKRIRNDAGYWQRIEAFISEHSEAEFSHSLCPQCQRELYPELYQEK